MHREKVEDDCILKVTTSNLAQPFLFSCSEVKTCQEIELNRHILKKKTKTCEFDGIIRLHDTMQGY